MLKSKKQLINPYFCTKLKDMDIVLNIEDSKYETFLAMIKTLHYVTIVKENKINSNEMGEPLVAYQKKRRPSVDEIEQLIIAKALNDAQSIECGELETREFDSIEALIADLEADTNDDEL